MTAGAPWSVKGIDPKAREVAKDLARRSGMTLGEWLNRVILEDDVPEEVTSHAHFGARSQRVALESPRSFESPSIGRTDDLSRVVAALDRLTDKIEASETRTGLAVSGVEHSVRHAMARIESAERQHVALATDQEAIAQRLAAEQEQVADRVRRMEAAASGPRSIEALRALERSVTKVAGAMYEGDRHTREKLADLEARLSRSESLSGGDPTALVDAVIAQLGQRLQDAETRTAGALESLRDSLAELDQRVGSVSRQPGQDFEHRFESLANHLTEQVERARQDMAERLASTAPGQVEARIDGFAEQLRAAEQRSADAIERMSHEVLSMADTLHTRVQSAEERSAEAIEKVGGEIARIAGAVESRLGRVDQLHAEALERLGQEISKITESLSDRILQSEKRAAQAIDDVGEQVARVSERMERRHDRTADDFAERLRQSDARAAHQLETLRAPADDAHTPTPVSEPEIAAEAEHEVHHATVAAAEAFSAPSISQAEETEDAEDKDEARERSIGALFGAELFSRAEPAAPPALDPVNPAFAAEDFAAADSFAPIEESDDDSIPPPPAGSETEAPAPLSTREVIERARAAAREAGGKRASGPQPAERRHRPGRGGLFGARPHATWQTALLVAGGAAFLSVGAAGVVLLEGPNMRQEAEQVTAMITSPRAAVALTPPPAAAAPPAQAQDAIASPAAGLTVTGEVATVAQEVEQGVPGALARMKSLADAGKPAAQLYLAKLYEEGSAGVTRNLGEARRWTQSAAEGGDASAMHNLALFYYRGEGGAADPVTAARWFRKAAERGVVDSQYNLGLLYQSGSGVPKDLPEAYKWLSIAAQGGDSQAESSARDVERQLSGAQLAAAQTAIAAYRPPTPPTATAKPVSGMTEAAAQMILGRLGYYKKAPGQTFEPDLKLAIAAYQRDQGLDATGQIDPATASRLSIFMH